MKKLRSVVLPLVIINIIIFVIQMLTGGVNGWFTSTFLLYSPDVLTRPWILLTSIFLHGNPMHLIFNMYVLLMFGGMLEQSIGPKRFLVLYFVSGFLASILSTPFYIAALGASGAIMGMMGALMVLRPDIKVLFFFVVPLPLWVAGIVIAIIDLFGVFYPSGTANVAHLAGLTVGLIFGYVMKEKRKSFQKKFTGSTHLDKNDIDQYFKTGRI